MSTKIDVQEVKEECIGELMVEEAFMKKITARGLKLALVEEEGNENYKVIFVQSSIKQGGV